MPSLLESGLLTLMHTIAFMVDVVTYIPYYFIQEPRRVLELSNRVKAVPSGNHPAGPYKCVEEPELTTTPDEDCSTLDELFQKACSLYADSECLGTREFFREEEEVQPNGKVFKKMILGEYQWLTYREVNEMVHCLGKGLVLSGLKPREKILIFAETRADWMICAQACFRQNFPVVTLYATLGDEAIIHGVNETEVTHIITSGDLLPKFKKLLARMPSVYHITYMKGRQPVNVSSIIDGRSVTVITMEEVISNGRACGDIRVESPPTSRDLAVVMYTSGSTGIPKGVLLSNLNVLSAVSGLQARACVLHEDSYVGYLPLAHILELCAEITCLCVGCKIGYSNPNTLSDASTAIKKGCQGDVSILKPTLMACVPTVMDRIYKSVWDKVLNGGTIKRVLFKFAIAYKEKWSKRGANTPLVNAFVMSSIRHLLGGRVRAVLSGGAPLNPKTQTFLRLTLCCPVIQGYGLTETCCAGTISDVDDLNEGHVGAALSCTNIKLVDWEEGGYTCADTPPRGEVWIGGPSVALGYFKNPEKTDEDFHERAHVRWFATGDIGKIKSDGTLQIIDRRKDLVKLQAGEYVSLGKVEATLKLCSLVDNICVHAKSDQNYVVAIIVPNPKAVQDLANSLNVSGNWSAICSNSEVTTKLLAELHTQAKSGGLQRFETPQKIFITSDVWTPDTGLVTDSLKLKRKPLIDYYNVELQRLYSVA